MNRLELYPRSWTMLVAYLKEHPVMKLKLPSKDSEITYLSCDGVRINFMNTEGNLVSFACQGLIGGKIEYNEDGFSRTIGKLTAWYYYTGPKPWQNPKPEWKQKIEDWDIVISGLKGFAD